MSDSLRFLRSYLHRASIATLLLILPATGLSLSRFDIENAAGLNDTGITTCSNETENGLPCPVAGFPGQDAEFGSNGFDFTKLDAAGNDLPATATDHTCVRDNVTGLIWQVKFSELYYTFDQAADYANNVTRSRAFFATSWCGFTDWRMPNIKELMGIADHSIAYPGPTIDTNYFPNTPSSWFWSGSPYANGSGGAWGVDFDDGYADFNYRGYDGHVRLVRGGQSFDTFVDNADGTVTQSNTGLMWAKCSEGQSGTNCTGDAKTMNWSAALTAANNSNLGGYNDWRLPNIKELQALVDYSRYKPAIDTTQFPNTPSSWFWSGSPLANYANFAWSVYFGSGYAYNDGRNYGHHVRLVRGGQSFDPFDSLNVNKTGSGSGSVSSIPAGINCGAICAADFNRGSEITLTAAPDANSTFSGWSGACTNKTGDCTVTMSEAQTVTATFIAKPITYKLSVSKVGDGSVKSDPTGINCGSDCVASFDKGKVVTLTATAATGYSFGGWSGACSNTSGTCSVSMASAKTVTATFIVAAPVTYKLTVTKTGSGSINSDPTGINCGSNCSANFESGSAVILTAEPASGYEFNRWNGCTPFATNPLQCQVDINKAQTVSATFTAAAPTAPVNYQLTVKKTGSGSINSDPNGINCGSDCSANFESGKTITLIAEPASGFTFVSWNGCTASTTNKLQCQFDLTANKTVTATFAAIPTTSGALTIKTIGNGSVISDPLGINCGSLCAASFTGRTVTLTALPASGEKFVRWNGCIANATNPMQCRVTLTKTITVTAEFSNKTTLEADIQITNVVLTPVSPSAGKIFTAQITLKNIGNIALTSGSHLEVWANEPTGQSCGAIGDAFADDIGQLARNDSTTITVKLIAPVKGMQRLRVFADSQCKVTELSERNNQLVKRYTVK